MPREDAAVWRVVNDSSQKIPDKAGIVALPSGYTTLLEGMHFWGNIMRKSQSGGRVKALTLLNFFYSVPFWCQTGPNNLA